MSAHVVSAEQQSDENGLQRSDDSVLFEDVLERCCGTGRWQVLLVSYMSVMWLIFPSFSLSMIFVGATPKYKCADGFDVNATFADLPEIMCDTVDDVLGFALCVQRPEEVVDAQPWQPRPRTGLRHRPTAGWRPHRPPELHCARNPDVFVSFRSSIKRGLVAPA